MNLLDTDIIENIAYGDITDNTIYQNIKRDFNNKDEITHMNKGGFISYILLHPKSSVVFQKLDKANALKFLIPHLCLCKQIPQKKRRSKNVFDHTLRVIESIPLDAEVLKWSALFHDLGKIKSYKKDGNFIKHALYSSDIAQSYLNQFRIPNTSKIVNIVKYHMYPLDYQRNPDWNKKSIEKMINKIGKDHILECIRFSIFDKLAENPYTNSVLPLFELIEKTKGILNESR